VDVIEGSSYNQLDNALKDCKKSHDLSPDDSVASYNFACVYSRQNNIDLAFEYLTKAIKMDPESAQHARNDLLGLLTDPRSADLLSE
jgi:tetratricopeptide (TPR) repeat protein